MNKIAKNRTGKLIQKEIEKYLSKQAKSIG